MGRKLLYSFPDSVEFFKAEEDFSIIGNQFIEIRGFSAKVPEKIAVKVNPTTLETEDVADFSFSPRLKLNKKNEKNQYLEILQLGIKELEALDIDKVVISREITFDFKGLFPIQSFLKVLREKYPKAYVFALQLENELWLGASPETFVRQQGNTVYAFSLAGTKKWQINNAPSWGIKEIEEQQIVTDFIQSSFKNESLKEVVVSPIENYRAGNVVHLLSTVSGILSDKNQLKSLKEALFPTPAVCGYPKEKAYGLIAELENYDRSLYAGYIGVGDNAGFNSWVNLRCMRVKDNEMSLFVGGGVTQQSVPEDEWDETVEKSKTLLSVLETL